jgi:uncharacterized membrane protein
MVIAWLRFAFRQIATALVLVTALLLLSEILLPSSILPYFNLHILVLVALVIASISPLIEEKSRLRMILLLPIAALLLMYAWFMFGMSISGLALFAALAVLLVALIVALARREPEVTATKEVEMHLSRETLIINDDGIEIIEEETDVFMR